MDFQFPIDEKRFALKKKLPDDLLQNEKVGSKFEQNPTTIPTRESKIQQNVKSTPFS